MHFLVFDRCFIENLLCHVTGTYMNGLSSWLIYRGCWKNQSNLLWLLSSFVYHLLWFFFVSLFVSVILSVFKTFFLFFISLSLSLFTNLFPLSFILLPSPSTLSLCLSHLVLLWFCSYVFISSSLVPICFCDHSQPSMTSVLLTPWDYSIAKTPQQIIDYCHSCTSRQICPGVEIRNLSPNLLDSKWIFTLLWNLFTIIE